jgi:transposase-like protein
VARWREIIARQRRSGTTVTEFCQREGLHPSLFRRWQGKLDGSGDRAQQRISVTPVSASPASFIELGALRSAAPRRSIRLELGQGIVLHLSGE